MSEDGIPIYAEYPDELESPEWQAADRKVTDAMTGARIRQLYPLGMATRYTDDARLAVACQQLYATIWVEAHDALVREEIDRDEHQG